MNCGNCNEEIPDTAKVCGFCGHKVQDQHRFASAAQTPEAPAAEAEQPPIPLAIGDDPEQPPSATPGVHRPMGSVPSRRRDTTAESAAVAGPLTVRIWSRRAALGSLLILFSLALPWIGFDQNRNAPSSIVRRFLHTPPASPFGPGASLRVYVPRGSAWNTVTSVTSQIDLGYVLLILGVLGIVAALSTKRARLAKTVGLVSIVLASAYLWRWADILRLRDVSVVHAPAAGSVLAIIGGILLLTPRYSKAEGEI